MPLINWERELDLSWSKECIIFEISIIPKIPGDEDADPPVQEVSEIQKTTATLEVDNAKLRVRVRVPVVILSIINKIKFSGNIMQVFKRTISWNKYRSEITTQPKYSNLDYLIGAKFKNVNRLFALSLKNGNIDPTRDSFEKYYMPLV